MSDWQIFKGEGRPAEPERWDQLVAPPTWRSFTPSGPVRDVDTIVERREYRLAELLNTDAVDMVNAALTLRRPLLVTGDAGVGKSTLAQLVATELRLGPVLRWPVTSASRLSDGLYEYDAIGHVRAQSLQQGRSPAADGPFGPGDIGRYIRLGPLGTALLPWNRPRVVLIDELDKSDIDLPNDLLHVFEEGGFRIRELARLAESEPGGESAPVSVLTEDSDTPTVVPRGWVRCNQFPFVVMTSNGERPFPAPFLRRCLRLKLEPPSEQQLETIVHRLLDGVPGEHGARIREFVEARETRTLATDQLIDAIYLAASCPEDRPAPASVELQIMQGLDPT
ncbi:ATPase AAA [Longispora fulva]|uniref:MoxR-like ATPase n=1 Tax=Longispora fulva TaxID=619741 RepID=A0A8J7GT38_9ACTN|nr:MoxR family ATPase [Longispora fulva]MBG6136636.1 MoxR-like ATPase [Longispora fulva]GIG59805.1 ATPase AAA [Longispora fulva]